MAATPGSQLEFWADAGRLQAGEYDAALYRLDDRGWERVESYPLTVVHSGR